MDPGVLAISAETEARRLDDLHLRSQAGATQIGDPRAQPRAPGSGPRHVPIEAGRRREGAAHVARALHRFNARVQNTCRDSYVRFLLANLATVMTFLGYPE